jgi:hypothetical protein
MGLPRPYGTGWPGGRPPLPCSSCGTRPGPRPQSSRARLTRLCSPQTNSAPTSPTGQRQAHLNPPPGGPSKLSPARPSRRAASSSHPQTMTRQQNLQPPERLGSRAGRSAVGQYATQHCAGPARVGSSPNGRGHCSELMARLPSHAVGYLASRGVDPPATQLIVSPRVGPFIRLTST